MHFVERGVERKPGGSISAISMGAASPLKVSSQKYFTAVQIQFLWQSTMFSLSVYGKEVFRRSTLM